ncbi:dihydrolipoamide acetyltransferase family protein [Streptomyces sp. SPB074]|uniref:dihydrolipoamide acetyltransferase family protein n=1 Tax=Streptomyces sp. (strain SPB074) TaxID=465543 RepID=UPI0001D1E37E|nr:dihydrolipoamide acetyltransferase family protein [Streptomyces sp. SPB074]EFG64946.1 pyruvate dehydrogenase E2 component [Streptomyces sp. SPB074]
MPQVLEFALPDLGEGLTEAQIVTWLVEVGDTVVIDQPVVEVETAKAMVEVPCPHGGVVTARHGAEGVSLPVGAPLVSIAVEEGDAGTGAGGAGTGAGGATAGAGGVGAGAGGATVDAGGPAASPSADAADAADGGSGNVLVGYGTATVTAVRRRRVRTSAAAPSAVRVSTTGTPAAAATAAPVTAADSGAAPDPGPAPAPAFEGPVPVISPLVRKLARDNGIDLRALSGSGPDGLIVRADVERAVADPARTPAAADVVTPPDAAEERVPLTGMRGAAAEKLSRSRAEIPDATCWVDADATELLAARAAMNTAAGPDAAKISVLALFARITSAALARFPELNSRVDTAAKEIVRLRSVHLGFAAQTERGLVVPVLREVQDQNTEELSAGIAELTRIARDGRLSPAQLTGGTFTLNNYGVFGVDGSTPIINHPEAAMLGIGRITPKPWVHEGALAVRQVVQLSLTFDHRVCDGGVAGGFLRYIADCVEQPALLLRTL